MSDATQAQPSAMAMPTPGEGHRRLLPFVGKFQARSNADACNEDAQCSTTRIATAVTSRSRHTVFGGRNSPVTCGFLNSIWEL